MVAVVGRRRRRRVELRPKVRQPDCFWNTKANHEDGTAGGYEDAARTDTSSVIKSNECVGVGWAAA